MYRHQGESVGTALHAIDRVQTISAAKSQRPGAAAAAAAGRLPGASAATAANSRRASHAGPVGVGRKGGSGPTSYGGVGGATLLNAEAAANGNAAVAAHAGTSLPRRVSTGQLNNMASAGSNFESMTTIGTPSAAGGGVNSMSRGLARAAGLRSGNDGLGRASASSNNLAAANGVGGAIAEREAPTDLRSAIEAGDVLAVGSMVRTMSQEEAEVELVAQDREQGTPLMQAAAGKNVQTYTAVMDAIRSRLGVEALMNELQARDLRAWCPLMHAAWSGSAEVFRAVVVAIEDNLGRDQVAEQLAATAKYGWTPLHAAARGNAEAMGAVMTALVNYMEADELKEQLSQSHDKDSDLPTPLMFAAASSSLDSRSLNPLLSELLGCMCDIDEARRQR
ncbi:unnamed protein product, partial [Ectocarpus fasciculatus]